MTAATTPRIPMPAWPLPPTIKPRTPRRGLWPVMVADDRGITAPLIEHTVHDQLCGIKQIATHPREPKLCRCLGCGLWLPTPMHLRRAVGGVR